MIGHRACFLRAAVPTGPTLPTSRLSRSTSTRCGPTGSSLQQSGEKITHAAVARTPASSWLTYADGVREHIEAAISGQIPPRPSRRDNSA
jgi:hypothetical protein